MHFNTTILCFLSQKRTEDSSWILMSYILESINTLSKYNSHNLLKNNELFFPNYSTQNMNLHWHM